MNIRFFCFFMVTLVSALLAMAEPHGKGSGPGQGRLSDEARRMIHSLFEAHEKVDRVVEKTADGYTAKTTSAAPDVAAMLQEHVAQMEERLEGGRSVRHWDPAFVELREHYDDMVVKIEKVDGGLMVSVTGKTPEAIQVAQNHADIVSGFVEVGPERMHAEHPTVLGAAPSEDEREQVAKTGQEASDALMKSLGGQLKAALQASGPVEAIQVCQQVALPLTSAAGESFEGASIRRTSLKVRNPANAADVMDRRVLKALAEAAGPPEPVIEWTEKTAHFYRPLMVQEVCLNCHGDPATFPAGLKETLATLYPDDKATGYAEGDLRGVIRVDVERSRP